MMISVVRSARMAVLLSILSLGSLGLAATPIPQPKNAINEPAVKDSSEDDHSILTFPKGHASLSDQSKHVLETLLRSQKRPFRDLKISIIAFSDEPYHSDVNNPRAPENVSLAKQRIEAVKQQLASLGSFADLVTYNMARPLSWYDRFMGSDREKLLSCLSGKKILQKELTHFAQVLQEDGYPSTAVVFVSSASSL